MDSNKELASAMAERMGRHAERSRWLTRLHQLVADPKISAEAKVVLYDLLKLACTSKLDEEPYVARRDETTGYGPS